jgi:hypothetical protein
VEALPLRLSVERRRERDRSGDGFIIDETPDAVMAAQSDLVEIIHRLACVKG